VTTGDARKTAVEQKITGEAMRYTVIGVWDHQGDDDTELIVAGVDSPPLWTPHTTNHTT